MPAYPPLDSPDLADILRPAREPFRHVSDALVHQTLLADAPAYLASLEQSLRDIANGNMSLILPPKAVFEDGPGKGDFRVMPCVTQSGERVVKSIKVVGTNLAQRQVPDQVTVGKAVLLDAEENFVTHLFDANILSALRTGACVALAIKLLAPQRRRIRFIGAGRVGFYGAALACTLPGIEAMAFTDPVPLRAASLARQLAGRHAGIRFSAGPPAEGECADVVVLATTATAPLCRPPAWGAGLIVSVGADTDYQRELDPAWADCADIVVDTQDSARFGDLRMWREQGLIAPDRLDDLFDVLHGRRRSDRPVLFVSTGSALFDNLTMDFLAQRLSCDGQSSDTKSSSL